MSDINLIEDPTFERSYPPPWTRWLQPPLPYLFHPFHWHVNAHVTDWPEPVPDPVRDTLGRAVELTPGGGGIYQWLGFAGERRDLHFAIRADGGGPVSVMVVVEYFDPEGTALRRVEHLKSRGDIGWMPGDFSLFGWIDVPIERPRNTYIASISVSNAASPSAEGAPVYVGRFDLWASIVDRREPYCLACRKQRGRSMALRSIYLDIERPLHRPTVPGLELPSLLEWADSLQRLAEGMDTLEDEIGSVKRRLEHLERKASHKPKIVEPA